MDKLIRTLIAGWLLLIGAVAAPFAASAAPFAAYVMDARTGKEIYSQNADARLHPASLTKMMTLYMAFTAIERGQVRLDSRFTVSAHAASQPPSRLGLRPGQQIELRYLIRAAAVKSANDAATVIGEGLAGSEQKFGAQMTAMARALGMRNSNFRNANGLTIDGHYSSARDLTLLGRRLFYDFPQYYSIFSRRTADAGIATVASTNKRFLDSYQGADGIKTGYTRAAGFNLTASAQRGSKRIIATVLGGQSTAQRNSIMAQLLDTGFGNAPSRVNEVRPEPPAYMVQKKRVIQVARAEPQPVAVEPTGQIRKAATASVVPVAPVARRIAEAVAEAAPQAAKAQSKAEPTITADASRPSRRPAAAAAETPKRDVQVASTAPATTAETSRPTRAPRRAEAAKAAAPASDAPAKSKMANAKTASVDSAAAPRRKSKTVILAAMEEEEGDRSEPETTEVVTRPSIKGGRYGVMLGRFKSQREAEQLLLKTALQESAILDSARRQVGNTKRGFEANFVGLSQDSARLLCEKLAARSQTCSVTPR